MDRDEMLKLLGLEDKPKVEPSPLRIEREVPGGEVSVEVAPANSRPVGDTCFNLDQWELIQGTRLGMQLHQDTLIMADLFAMCFRQVPEVDFDCADKRFGQFVATILESPDFKVLHNSTCASVLCSDMAAAQFAKQYQDIEGDTLAGGRGVDQNGDIPAIACLAAVGQALKEAQEEVDALEDMQSALGMGGNGGTDGQMDSKRVANVFKRVRNNAQLKRICELAGKFRRVAQSKQRQKTLHGYDDMVGVELSGDVSRLLPVELAMLADEDFELDAMRRLVERQSMSREYLGVEKQAKGPIIVCVDESGSMSGDPVCNAKAFALAMAWIANHQGRWCGLVSYSGGTEGHILALPPGKWDQSKLLDWLGHFYGGGTDMDVPLKELPTRYWQQLGAPRGKTDVILLTDAICHVPDKMRDDFNAWKQAEKVRCISLIIGQHGSGGLSEVSDEIHNVSTITPEDGGVVSCFTV